MTTKPTEVLLVRLNDQGVGEEDVGAVRCAFCGELAPGRSLEVGMLLGHFGWDCACGAHGVHAPLYDLDEVYPDVLEVWGLTPGEPEMGPPQPVPVGESGMLFATYVDGDSLFAQLCGEANRQGAEVATSRVTLRFERSGAPVEGRLEWEVLWARFRPAPGPN
jgi:hypothetical protein